MTGLLAILGLLAIFGGLPLLGRYLEYRRQRSIDAICRVLSTEAPKVSGDVKEIELNGIIRERGVVAVLHRGVDDLLPQRTEFRTETERSDVVLEVRPDGWLERWFRARKLANDLSTGNAEFDVRFVVDAAPEEMARLLDSDLTDRLLALRPISIAVDSKTVRLWKKGWMRDESEIQGALDVLTLVADRMNTPVLATGASAYRLVSPTLSADQVQQMLARRARRESLAVKVKLGVGLVLTVGVVLLARLL